MYRLIFFLVLVFAASGINALSIRGDFEDKDRIEKTTIYIAYIEDSIIHRKTFSRLVKNYNIQNTRCHIEVSLFENEDDFIATSHGSEFVHQFDLILTDMVMNKDFSGFLVAKHLSDKNYKNPIIAVTSDYEHLIEYYRSRDSSSFYNAHDPDASLFSEILPKLNLNTFSTLIEKFIHRNLNKSSSDLMDVAKISRSRNSCYINESIARPSSPHNMHVNRIRLPKEAIRDSVKIRKAEMEAQSHLLIQEIKSRRTFFCFCYPFFMSAYLFKNNKVHALN